MKKHLLVLSLLALGFGVTAQTPRLSLVEEFTGETCPPCASNNPAFNNLLSLPINTTNVVPIKWQVPIPSAPAKTWSLYQTNKAEINWRYSTYGYGINSAPSVRIDGQMPTVFGAGGQNITQMSSVVFATAQSYTSAFSITLNRAWNKTCSAITLTISITATAPFTSVGNLIFRTVMVERLIQFSVQPGTNGETKFEDVAIKSFPTLQSGVPMASSWILGQTQTFTLNCPVPSYTRKKEEIAFVGFIQDDGNRKVAQAVRGGVDVVPADAISAISANVNLTCNNVITPTVEIKNEGSANPITTLTLTPYIDGVAGAPFPWTGNLAPGASAFVALGSVNSPILAGSHTFSCDIDMTTPLYNLIKNTTKINYMVGGNYQGTPVSEGFTGATYPPTGFGVVNNDNGPGFSRSTLAGAYNLNFESTKYDFFGNTTVGDKDELYLPPMDLSNAANTQLSFDVAHAQRGTSYDALDVLVSSNCGTTWTNVYSRAGQQLATTQAVSYAYVPDSQDPSHWRTDGADLSAFNQPNVLVKFVTTANGTGNNLYLDNINLTFEGATGIANNSSSSLNVTMFPNPTNATTQVKLNGMKAGFAKVTLVNTLGQVVSTKQVVLSAGTNVIQLDTKEYASGVYNVTIDSEMGSVTKKLTVTK